MMMDLEGKDFLDVDDPVEWFNRFRLQGGRFYKVDFTQKYQQSRLDQRGRDTILLDWIKRFRNKSRSKVVNYSKISTGRSSDHIRYNDDNVFIELAVHGIWICKQPEILLRPSVRYNKFVNDYTFMNGNARAPALYMKTNEVPVILFKYPEDPEPEFEGMERLHELQDVIDAIRLDGKPFDKDYDVQRHHLTPMDKSDLAGFYWFICFGSNGKFNEECREIWRHEAVDYHQELQSVNSPERYYDSLI